MASINPADASRQLQMQRVAETRPAQQQAEKSPAKKTEPKTDEFKAAEAGVSTDSPFAVDNSAKAKQVDKAPDKKADTDKTELSEDFYKGVTDDPKVQKDIDKALFAKDSKLNKEEKGDMAKYLVQAQKGELKEGDKTKLESLLTDAGVEKTEIDKILNSKDKKDFSEADIKKFGDLLKKAGLEETAIEKLLTGESSGKESERAKGSDDNGASKGSSAPAQSGSQGSPPAGQVPERTAVPQGSGSGNVAPSVQADKNMSAAYKDYTKNITGVESLNGEFARLAADDPMNIVLHAIAREHNYESGKVTGLASHDYHSGIFQIPVGLEGTEGLRDAIGRATGEDILFKMPMKDAEHQAQLMSFLISNTEIFGNAGNAIKEARTAKVNNNEPVYKEKMAEGLQQVLAGLGAEKNPSVTGLDPDGMPNGKDTPSSVKNYAGMIDAGMRDIQETGLKFNAVTNDELKELGGNNKLDNGMFMAQAPDEKAESAKKLELVA